MANEKEIPAAADGVVEVPMTQARAQLTSLIRQVRYGGQVGAFAERGERRAYVVTPDFHDQAIEDRRINKSLWVIVDRILEKNPDGRTIVELAQTMDELRAEQSSD
ncbi:hypothetical protein [Streptomyces niveus]